MGIKISVLGKIANSNIGTKFFKWADTPKGTNFLNNTLPTLETFLATSCYTVAVENQDLDRRRKNLLHFQNWVPAIIGMGVGTYLNRKVSKFGDKIISYLDPKYIPNIHKIINATKVMLPICTTMILMRLALPVVTAFVSGEVEEYKAKKKGLDLNI